MLKARIAALETDNRELQSRINILNYVVQARSGIEREVSLEEGQRVKLHIAAEGWGTGGADNVASVCASVAETIFYVIRPAKDQELTILIVPNAQGPKALAARGPNNESIVFLNTQGIYLSQVAYQFAHELGHVLCGDPTLRSPQHWFEEAFCESLSIWTMDRMGVSWKTNAPYGNWKSYAPRLSEYSDNVKNRIPATDNMAQWYQDHRDELDRQPTDRDKNLVLARQLAMEAHKNPDFYQAFYYLRSELGPNSVNSIEWLLADWKENCPDDLKFAPQIVADLLKVTPQK